jgi:hypothetical protein
MVPPTIFFFIGFNLILLTTNLLVASYGATFGGFMLATGAALVVGKAVRRSNVSDAARSIPTPRPARAWPDGQSLPAPSMTSTRATSL